MQRQYALGLIFALLPSWAVSQQTQDPPLPLSSTLTITLADTGDGFTSTLDTPPTDGPRPIITPQSKTIEAGRLRRGFAQGNMAGLDGVLYDNRDLDHSPLHRGAFPQLTHIRYGEGAARFGNGLAGRFNWAAPVIGNSSTAILGKNPRSLVRHAMTSPGGPAAAAKIYFNNGLYIYPEHRDHDAVDFYPANWPYTVTVQGSSYKDKPFVQSFLMAMAAFRPETRRYLEDTKLIAPTLQMIMRRSMANIIDDSRYVTGAAHPSAFEGDNLRPGRMISLANALRPETVPPVAMLSVVEEATPTPSEVLFDTSAAIARVWTPFEGTRKIKLAATPYPAQKNIRFHWVVLRGDADITVLSDGTEAVIELGWQPAYPINRANPRTTQRVDIGVFADNGHYIGAPSFFSVSFRNTSE